MLHVQSAPHVAQLRHAHVDGHGRQRAGGDALWAVYGDALVAGRVPVKIKCATAYPFEEKIAITVSRRRKPNSRSISACPSGASRRRSRSTAATCRPPTMATALCGCAGLESGRQVTLKVPMPIRIEGGHDHGVERGDAGRSRCSRRALRQYLRRPVADGPADS